LKEKKAEKGKGWRRHAQGYWTINVRRYKIYRGCWKVSKLT